MCAAFLSLLLLQKARLCAEHLVAFVRHCRNMVAAAERLEVMKAWAARAFSTLPASRVAAALAISLILAYRGLRKKSLDRRGAIAAFIVGFVSFSCLVRSGTLLIMFYLSGSQLTRIGAAIKEKRDADYRPGGQRSAGQVLACSFLATALSACYFFLRNVDRPVQPAYDLLGARLLCGILGHYACCAADTWASEVGVFAATASPRLITQPWRKVPHGTNGGVTLVGTLAAILGGGFMGAVFVLNGYFLHGNVLHERQLRLIFGGALAGLIGTTIDSILGATLQTTYVHTKSGKVTSETPEEDARGDYKLVCGADVLSNQDVNTVSVILTTVVSARLIPLLMML